MSYTTSYTGYPQITPVPALTANACNALHMTTSTNNTQRRLFASLAGPIPDDENDQLLHPALYPVPVISKHARQARSSGLSQQQQPQQNLPSVALASAISRKLQPTLAQIVSADAEDVEDTNMLFALIASTNAAACSNPVRVPSLMSTSFDSLNSQSATDNAYRPHSRGSSSCSSFEHGSDEEFDFDDDEDVDDAASSVSSVSSVESCFDFLASTKPQSQSHSWAQAPSVAVLTAAPIAAATASAALFVPPQVRTHMNMLRFSRARAHSTVSNDSTSSSASSAGSWRSSAPSMASSRSSISSMSSVSTSPAPSSKAKPTSSSPSLCASASIAVATQPLAGKETKTKYLYQGGVSTVLGGGVMLGGASVKAAPRQNQKTTNSTYRVTTTTTTNSTASAPSWRRGAPTSSTFSRA